MILQFPKNNHLLEKNGFDGIKIDKDLAARIRGYVSKLQYSEVSELHGDKLYSVGTKMAKKYNKKKLHAFAQRYSVRSINLLSKKLFLALA